MRTGKHPPFISQESVRLALETLVYSTTRKQTSLLSLSLIDEFLANPDLPNFSLNREFALKQILVSVITAEFSRQRNAILNASQKAPTSRDDAFQTISVDAVSNSPELIGWSWLYHHYVRVELNIHAEEFSKLIHVDERTLRRYQQHIIKCLTNLLIKMEWEARIRFRKERLLNELPSAGVLPPLIGRENEFAYVRRKLPVAKPPHFQVTGTRGIGKTVFVESILKELIEAEEVERVIWVRMPISAEYVYDYLTEYLLTLENHRGLRDYLREHRTVVVIDDIELLYQNLGTLRGLLQFLNPCIVFVTCSVHLAIPSILHVALNEFSEEDSYVFAQSLFFNQGDYALTDALNSYARLIWERVGGNPLAIQFITANHSYLDVKSFNEVMGLNSLCHQIFQSLDVNTRYVWIALTLLPYEEIRFNTLHKLWPAQIKYADLRKLLHYHLLEISNRSSYNSYRLVNSARRYIEDTYRKDHQIQQMVNHLIRELTITEIEDAPSFLSVLEHILITSWIELDADMRKTWILQWYKEGIRQKHWTKWRLLIATQLQPDLIDTSLYIGYAVCLRHLGVWDLAEQSLVVVLYETGRKGKFIQQVEGLLELSIVARYKGQYERALELLNHAQQIAQRHKSNALFSALAVEMTQVAIDLGDSGTAESFMMNLPETGRTQLFRSELCLLKEEYAQSRFFAEAALKNMGKDYTSNAQIYTLIGRAYEQESNLVAAQEFFSWAVMILERQEDFFSLSRAQSNLGALFVRTGHYDEASILLNAAMDIQVNIKDRVALAITKHNLRLLRNALSS